MRRGRTDGRESASEKLDPPRVEGLVVNLGADVSTTQRRRILEQLATESTALAQFVGPRGLGRIRPLGRDAADILVRAGRPVSVEAVWDLAHELRRHRLVWDCEPAIQIGSEYRERGAGTASIGRGRHLPESAPQSWSLAASGVLRAWQASAARGAGVLIGHPDTGYTLHPEIHGAIKPDLGYDFEGNRRDPVDTMTGLAPGHGTATASVIASRIDPAAPIRAVAGSAPEADLIPLRVSTSVVHFSFVNLASALYWAREAGCHLVSMSLGGPWAGRTLGRAVDRVIDDGLILLAAAGNVWPWVVYPAKFDRVIAVGAINACERPWRGSARGPQIDVSAPGESVWRASVERDGSGVVYDVNRSSGTSYAVATTAGACALWLSHHGPTKLRKQFGGRLAGVFQELLRTEGIRVPDRWRIREYGAGILDAERLLAAPLPDLPPISASPATMARSERTLRNVAWMRLQPYFPEADLDALAEMVFPLFARRGAQAADRIADVIDELEFHIATDSVLRASLLAGTEKRLATATGGAARSGTGAAAGRWRLRNLGSRRLRASVAR